MFLVGTEMGRRQISQSTTRPIKSMQLHAMGHPADAGGIGFFAGRKGTQQLQASVGPVIFRGPARGAASHLIAQRRALCARMQPTCVQSNYCQLGIYMHSGGLGLESESSL